MSAYIERIQAFGVHGSFNIDLEFQDGINILYGKNGTGKTTVLHILANALNADYDRFVDLLFDSITIQLKPARSIKIVRAQDKNDVTIRVFSGKKKIHEALGSRVREMETKKGDY